MGMVRVSWVVLKHDGFAGYDELIQKARWRPKATMTRIASGTKEAYIYDLSECQNKGSVSITFNRDESCA
jgi:hypothetical protein